MKKHLMYYTKGLPEAKMFRLKLFELNNVNDILNTLRDILK